MKNWAMFGTVGLIWGSSFLLIKIGVSQLNPLALVSGRTLVASLGFAAMIFLLRKPFPRDRKTLGSLILVGILNTALPFVLITWGESTIDSGLASVLNGTVPLFSLVIAHFLLNDDKIHIGKILGLGTGFVGILLLASRSVDPTHPNPIGGQLAVLCAAISYAFAAVVTKRNLKNVDLTITAGVSMIFAAAMVLTVTLITLRPLPDLAALEPKVVLAVVILGLLNTFVANTFYFRLINNWGASRTTMVTYTVPPTGILLGALFDNEPIDAKLIIGALLIVGGVALVNLLRPRTKAIQTSPEPEVSSAAPVGEVGN